MDWLLTFIARGAVGLIQRLPLTVVARLGRRIGALVWWIDARHRRVAVLNLTRCLGHELTPAQLRDVARENFRRIGENFACAAKTAGMSEKQLDQVLQITGLEHFQDTPTGTEPTSRVIAIGHFGNFELFAKCSSAVPGYQFATTYRALREPGLNRVMQALRERSGCLFFERRFEAEGLKAAMQRGGIMLGLLSDQHGGRKGIWGPFLGHECSTTPAPAVLALRYKCPLFTAFCYRTGLAQWRIEVGPSIPTHDPQGHARRIQDIILDMNLAFETAVRRDPANWFWVHRRWKPRGKESPAAGATDGTDLPNP